MPFRPEGGVGHVMVGLLLASMVAFQGYHYVRFAWRSRSRSRSRHTKQ